MIKKINHIGIAVQSLGLSAEIFSKLFGIHAPHTEVVPQQKATISFFPVGESSLELIASDSTGSAITKFIQKRGEGIHHICLEVTGLSEEIARLKKHGFVFINDIPTEGGEGYNVVFIHPKSANGVLIELCEKM